MNLFTILHISDLHRTQTRVSNGVLINSLEYVLNECVKEGRQPQLLVVSGDLIQGSKSDSEDQVMADLGEQYQEALEFLEEIVSLYLNGDKDKVIIIPGNHDVSYYHSKKSMKKAQAEGDPQTQKKWLYQNMMRMGSRIRWSWSDFEFYHIMDDEMYRRRLEAFSNFYRQFYDDKKMFSLDPEKQFEILDYEDLNTTVVGFNSCHDNDHCNSSGAIHTEVLAQVERELRHFRYRKRLRIAVWHHHTSGDPNKSDYMDNKTLQHLMRANFHIGLHGHAHITGVSYEPYRLQTDQQMVIISAGSLCAGDDEFPPGEMRSFNMIHLNLDSQKATVDIYRDSQTGLVASPMWITTQQDSLQWYSPKELDVLDNNDLQKTNIDSQEKDFLIIQADQLVTEKKYEDALKVLEQFDSKDNYVRRLLLNCYQGLSRHVEILKLIPEPVGTEEIMALISAAAAEGEEILVQVLHKDVVLKNEDLFVKRTVEKYRKLVE